MRITKADPRAQNAGTQDTMATGARILREPPRPAYAKNATSKGDTGPRIVHSAASVRQMRQRQGRKGQGEKIGIQKTKARLPLRRWPGRGEPRRQGATIGEGRRV